jgi:hypothetical protein
MFVFCTKNTSLCKKNIGWMRKGFLSKVLSVYRGKIIVQADLDAVPGFNWIRFLIAGRLLVS